jgi:hypothetical protein
MQNYATKIFISEIYVHTMNRICIELEFQYALSRQICKCLKFRVLVIGK